ncbi:MAG: hypothetical protein ACK4SX_08505 [Alcanivoracaceae bacterium]
MRNSRITPYAADGAAPRQGGAAVLTGVMMVLILLTPLILWLGIRDFDDRQVPSCHTSTVMEHLRAATSADAPFPETGAIRDIQTMGLDTRLGHRICYARIGDGAGAQTVKFAVRYSAAGQVQVEVVGP